MIKQKYLKNKEKIMRNKKQSITLALASTMLLSSFASCGMQEVSFKEYEDYDAFRFYAYMTPPPANVGGGSLMDNPDYMTEQQYDWVKECGFNYGVAIYETTYDQSLKVLKEFEERDMKFFLKDANINTLINGYIDNNLESGKEAAYKAAFEKNLQEYLKYDSFAGIYAADEPKTQKMAGIGKAAEYFYSLEGTSDREWWVNLLGSGYGANGSDSYVEHVNTAAQTTGAGRLSFDEYPLYVGKIRSSFFSNLAHMAAVGKVHNQVFDTFILTMGHWDYRTTNNYDDLAWQIYSSMAFGTRGIETFTYWTTMGTGEGITHGLIDHYGNRTQTWYSMQEVISEVNSFQHMYMNAEWQGVMTYTADEDYSNDLLNLIPSSITVGETDVPVKMKSHERIASVKSDNDLLIGSFKDKDNRDAFMVVNVVDPDFDDSATVTLTFNDCDYVVIYKKGEKVVAKAENGVVKLNMGSSEGYYVMPMKLAE